MTLDATGARTADGNAIAGQAPTGQPAPRPETSGVAMAGLAA
ncbi:MAG: hypothetical protein AVDCRST_MAG88-506, partial [uncultured Thermomicrobiales bacterium]